MSVILAIIVFILFVGLFIILSVLGFLRSLLGFGKRKNPVQNKHSEPFSKPSSKKIFDKKEGEYVDYEEVE